jgi:MFS family permease
MNKNKIPFLTLGLIFFTMLPVTMIVPVFKDIIKDKLGGNNLMVSLFMSYAMLGSFLFSPVAGFLSDKFKNRKLFISFFAFIDGFCFYLLSQSESMFSLQLIRFVEGAAHIFVIALLLALISDRENDQENKKFYKKGLLLGIAGMLLSLGVGIGSPLGVLGKKNPFLPFYFASGIMFLISIISYIFLKDYEFYHREKINFSKWKEAFKQNKLILIPYIYNFIDRFTVGFFVTSFNLRLREYYSMSAGEVGLFLSSVLIPMSLLSYPFAILSKKVGSFKLMMFGSLIYGIGLSVSGGIESKTILFFILLLTGLGAGVMFVPSMIFCSELAPKGFNASVISGFTGIGSVGFMLGPIFAALLEIYIKNNFQSQNHFLYLSIFFGSLEILVVLFTFPFYKKLKERI